MYIKNSIVIKLLNIAYDERKIPIDEIIAVKPAVCARSTQNSSSTLQHHNKSDISLESDSSVEPFEFTDVDVEEDLQKYSQYYVVQGGSPTGNATLVAGPNRLPPPQVVQPQSNSSAIPGFQFSSESNFYIYAVNRIRPTSVPASCTAPLHQRASNRNSNERSESSSEQKQMAFEVEEQHYMWRVRRLVVRCQTPQIATEWLAQLRAVLFAGSHRPRRLLALVNPISGRGKSLEVLAQVQPYFQLAGIRLDICGIPS